MPWRRMGKWRYTLKFCISSLGGGKWWASCTSRFAPSTRLAAEPLWTLWKRAKSLAFYLTFHWSWRNIPILVKPRRITGTSYDEKHEFLHYVFWTEFTDRKEAHVPLFPYIATDFELIKIRDFVRFEVSTSVIKKRTVFWVVTLCNMIYICTDVSEGNFTYTSTANPCILKAESESSPEMSTHYKASCQSISFHLRGKIGSEMLFHVHPI
jgi:hypothetical protein